ncbi:hypothetical protein FIBSPDRAFT_918282 [Athelia psychrophila]|uniref:Multidrug resistance-associated ABC transporter n=1 Tax=Athelia psychrophila TaxID=1759441 RepID=A0A166PDM9_9AGAM|nr:hypothetical protein FIBSPDRAFT_918282 [Fibularhizoctonia sp. CBS 109695]
MNLCPGSPSPFEFADPCIRESWAAIFPAALVFLLCVSKLPISIPASVQNILGVNTFKRFLTLHEAEALDAASDDASAVEIEVTATPPLSWLALASYRLVTQPFHPSSALPYVLALPWIYAALRPLLRPPATPPYDLFALFAAHLAMGALLLGGVLYTHYVLDGPPAAPLALAGLAANVASVLVGLAVVMDIPMDVPSSRVKEGAIGKTATPEDYTTLFKWMTFAWVYPLVQLGTATTLHEQDVWDLSPTMQSRPVFIQFGRTARPSLLRQLWAANALDVLIDFGLTYVSVVFTYAGPFFLKRILDAIDADSTPEDRARAYVYAGLAFAAQLAKAQADVQHLWFGRRAATRMRSQLMAAIYDKALKRKDFSGLVDADKADEARERRKSAEERARDKKARKDAADDPKAGANTGKIVNLMSGDANRIAQMISGAYFLYGAPMEILIAGIFLYQLLGWSAFAGFLVLLVGWPLNSFLMKRSVRIQKGAATSRDKRMAVINELVAAVKFIKFFAWEEQWIGRALDAREVEMKWMIKARMNSVMFSLLWILSPILVACVGFFTFVMQGNELTVSIAFTAIALFNMIRAPLNVIPAWIVQILQTKIALDRIAVYLDEDEVSAQVSTLKRPNAGPAAADEDAALGIEHGSFRWNAVDAAQETAAKSPSPSRVASDATAVASETASTSSEAADHQFELRDISVVFPDGKLSCITGPTASGKTALLMALLGEMTLQPGGRIIMAKNPSRVDAHGLMHAISYAAQSPWLRHQSIKDNILFGYPYDAARYNDVIECCALQTDLGMFEDGDDTEIGARGVSLSGGQKARVALARAVYARTKYVLLDDPLSAVDSQTSRFLFEKLLQGPLLAHRTVILVTHHVELVLPGTHYLVRMLDGRIDTQGTVEELRSQGVLDDIAHDEAVEVLKEEEAVAVDAAVDAAADLDGEAEAEAEAKPAGAAKKPRKMIKDEAREYGAVKWSIYNTYLRASSYWTWGILTVLIVVAQLLGVGEKLWIRQWGNAYGKDYNQTAVYSAFSAAEHQLALGGSLSNHHYQHFLRPTDVSTTDYNLPRAQDNPLFYVGIYTMIGFMAAATSILSTIVQYTGALRASRLLFKRLLLAVVRATMRWHDVTPQGRMLNRFGKDIMTIDQSLAGSLQAVNGSLATFFAAILTVAYFFPVFLIPAFLVGLIYRRLAIGYLETGRDLRRMESNTRSPIFSGFGELLEGIVTVRAFSSEKRFMDDLHSKIDMTTKMWYSFWMTNRWLLLNFDALGALIVLITTLLSLSSWVEAGTAALCMTSAMSFTSSIYWACRFWTALELDLNSVERLVEYLDLPQEPPAIIESNRPPAYWPSSTTKDSLITVENLTIKYAPELPAVLHNVSFELKAKERIGLLGRTGSGKSTLAMSILRFIDPASGRILIDGIDISTIGVHDLRSRLTFIPQDATLFSGTLRDNLDPFGEHSDNDCLDVLYRVQMISESAAQSQRGSRQPSRAASPDGTEREGSVSTMSITSTGTDIDAKATVSLDTQVSAGGTNFSQGQRQLLAMARALLRRSAVIVLDEATSSIDFATDAKIQATIREEFNDSLLLTVPNRCPTATNNNPPTAWKKEKIAEFDTPLTLINKPDGIFRTMCMKSGTFGELEAAAQAKADRDNQKQRS